MKNLLILILITIVSFDIYGQNITGTAQYNDVQIIGKVSPYDEAINTSPDYVLTEDTTLDKTTYTEADEVSSITYDQLVDSIQTKQFDSLNVTVLKSDTTYIGTNKIYQDGVTGNEVHTADTIQVNVLKIGSSGSVLTNNGDSLFNSNHIKTDSNVYASNVYNSNGEIVGYLIGNGLTLSGSTIKLGDAAFDENIDLFSDAGNNRRVYIAIYDPDFNETSLFMDTLRMLLYKGDDNSESFIELNKTDVNFKAEDQSITSTMILDTLGFKVNKEGADLFEITEDSILSNIDIYVDGKLKLNDDIELFGTSIGGSNYAKTIYYEKEEFIYLTNLSGTKKLNVVGDLQGDVIQADSILTAKYIRSSTDTIKVVDNTVIDSAMILNDKLITSNILTLTNDTVLPNNNNSYFIKTYGSLSITMPDAVATKGQNIVIKKMDNTGAVVTIYPYSGQTLEGKDSIFLQNQYQTYTFMSDDTNQIAKTKQIPHAKTLIETYVHVDSTVQNVLVADTWEVLSADGANQLTFDILDSDITILPDSFVYYNDKLPNGDSIKVELFLNAGISSGNASTFNYQYAIFRRHPNEASFSVIAKTYMTARTSGANVPSPATGLGGAEFYLKDSTAFYLGIKSDANVTATHFPFYGKLKEVSINK